MPKINQEEYEVLKGLDDKWKWIARDRDRLLFVFNVKPRKGINYAVWDIAGWDDDDYLEIEDSQLFQFIQWEDEEPYNIAELIEEYEREEKEVKDLEWAVKEIESLMTEESQSYPHDKMIEQEIVLGILKQLEVETLSQDWIDNHTDKFVGNEGHRFVSTNDLQNLLVPKQFRDEFNSILQTLPISSDELLSEFKSFVASGGIKLKQEEITEMNVNDLAYFITQVENEGLIVIEKPVIPQFVADWIEEMKQEERPLYSVMSTLMNKTNHKWSVWKSANKNFSEIVAQAWLDGFTVEEEPQYIIKTGDERYLSQLALNYVDNPPVTTVHHMKEMALRFSDRELAQKVADLVNSGEVEELEE